MNDMIENLLDGTPHLDIEAVNDNQVFQNLNTIIEQYQLIDLSELLEKNNCYIDDMLYTYEL